MEILQEKEPHIMNDADPLQAFCLKYDANSPEHAMAIACERLRNKADLKSPPFNLERMLSICNAKVSNSADIDILGRLEFGNGSFIIKVKADDSRIRKRFTVAHEIAHILVIRAVANSIDNLRALRSPAIHDRLERLCNFGAAELLSPQQDFLQIVQTFGFTRESITKMHDRYDVSYGTIFRRFTDISGNCTLSLWKLYERSQRKGDLLRIVDSFAGVNGLELKNGVTSKSIAPNILHFVSRSKKERVTRAAIRIENRDIPILIFAMPFHTTTELLVSLEKAYDYQFDVVSLIFPIDKSTESDVLLKLLPVVEEPQNY